MKLADLSQLALDMYYQDYAPDDAYLDMDHFKMVAASTYANLLAVELRNMKMINKQETGFSYVEITPNLLVYETTKVNKEGTQYLAKLTQDVFSFDYDRLSLGVQMIDMVGEEVLRISMSERNALKRTAFTNKIFAWVRNANEIAFISQKDINGKSVTIGFVPKVDFANDESEIAADLAIPLITQVLNLMFGAKNGNVIDKRNDSNPNIFPTGEVNKESLKQ